MSAEGSQEVRWFFDQPLDDAALAEFLDGDHGNLLAQERRQDDYLVLHGRDDMGIKWRGAEHQRADEQLLQFKGRVDERDVRQWHGAACGRVERWVKWSYRGREVPWQLRRSLTAESGGELVSIAKRRFRRIVGGNVADEPAVEVELGELLVGETRFSTLAFEAFPRGDELDAFFDETVGLWTSRLGDRLALDESHSYAYPALLQRLDTSQRER